MTLYCIKCGRPSFVTGQQEPCPPPCNGAVFVSTPPRRLFTVQDVAFLRSIRIKPDET